MDKAKKKILNNLRNTFCRLERSKIHGIGIIAIRDISKNTDPFYGVQKRRWRAFKPKEIENLDKETKKMIYDFLALKGDKEIFIPERGLNSMDISFFLNTSKKPNVKTIDGGENFRTIRKIKKGEEVTVSYSDYDLT